MKKISCCLLAGVLLLAPTFTALGSDNPRIITLDGANQLGTHYNTDFGNNLFSTQVCENPTTIQGIQAWGGTSYIRLGDFNGNGRLDIASPHGSWILIKTTDPESPFHFVSDCLRHKDPAPVTNSWGAAPFTWVGDFNGDGKDDIASASGSSVYMKLSNAGSFAFTGFTSQTWFLTTTPPQAPQNPLWGSSDYTWIGDFNGDNRDDIASAVGSSVRVHLSTGSSFTSQTWNVTGPWSVPGWNRVGDFNGDGRDDIASPNGTTVHMKLSTGSGFTSTNWNVAGTWGSAGYTWVADFNRDGRADIASADAGNVRMKLSTGTGFSSANWPVINDWGGAQYTWVMDFNSDGYKDIVSAFNGWTIVTKRNTSGTGFASESWNYFGWWGPADNTWALD